jgi:cystathionine beta-lyase/cystathionine gamma-synthase
MWDLPALEEMILQNQADLATFGEHGIKEVVDPSTNTTIKQVVRRIKVLHLESPSNPLLKIADITAISEICRPHGILVSVDATAMSPLLMQPLELGADIVVHSATKWISGEGILCDSYRAS